VRSEINYAFVRYKGEEGLKSSLSLASKLSDGREKVSRFQRKRGHFGRVGGGQGGSRGTALTPSSCPRGLPSSSSTGRVASDGTGPHAKGGRQYRPIKEKRLKKLGAWPGKVGLLRDSGIKGADGAQHWPKADQGEQRGKSRGKKR